MFVSVTFSGRLPLVATNAKLQKTRFDATFDPDFPARYASPMEVMLESLAACSMMDIIAILRKKRKTIKALHAEVEAERAETHPKVFTSIRLVYRLQSPDCSQADFEKSVGLSIGTYCSVAGMLRNSGCSIAWTAELAPVRPRQPRRRAAP